MNLRVQFGLLAILAPFSACIPIPITPVTVEGRSVAEEDSDALDVGMPRSMVEARIGPPAIYWEEARIAVYGWHQEEIYFVTYGSGSAWGPFRYLLCEYDSDDRLSRKASSGLFDVDPPRGNDLIDWWLEGGRDR